MTFTLTPEQAAMVEELIQHGVFEEPNQVLSAAFDLLAERKEEYDRKLNHLRAEIDLGDAAIERGELVDFDPEAIKARVRQRLERERRLEPAVR
jgi:Arc/MetJ-type ribon-helix-helix transcriptional regulator